MNEAELQRTVLDAARLGGWIVHHSRPALTSTGRWVTPLSGDPGLPDLILVRERVLWLELKSERGVVSTHQTVWIGQLRKAGQDVRVVRPADLDGIVAELIAKPRRVA